MPLFLSLENIMLISLPTGRALFWSNAILCFGLSIYMWCWLLSSDRAPALTWVLTAHSMVDDFQRFCVFSNVRINFPWATVNYTNKSTNRVNAKCALTLFSSDCLCEYNKAGSTARWIEWNRHDLWHSTCISSSKASTPQRKQANNAKILSVSMINAIIFDLCDMPNVRVGVQRKSMLPDDFDFSVCQPHK